MPKLSLEDTGLNTADESKCETHDEFPVDIDPSITNVSNDDDLADTSLDTNTTSTLDDKKAIITVCVPDGGKREVPFLRLTRNSDALNAMFNGMRYAESHSLVWDLTAHASKQDLNPSANDWLTADIFDRFLLCLADEDLLKWTGAMYSMIRGMNPAGSVNLQSRHFSIWEFRGKIGGLNGSPFSDENRYSWFGDMCAVMDVYRMGDRCLSASVWWVAVILLHSRNRVESVHSIAERVALMEHAIDALQLSAEDLEVVLKSLPHDPPSSRFNWYCDHTHRHLLLVLVENLELILSSMPDAWRVPTAEPGAQSLPSHPNDQPPSNANSTTTTLDPVLADMLPTIVEWLVVALRVFKGPLPKFESSDDDYEDEYKHLNGYYDSSGNYFSEYDSDLEWIGDDDDSDDYPYI